MKYIPSSSYASPGGPSAIPKMVQKRRTFHVFGFVATVLLFGSVLSAGGVVFYKKELEKQLTEAQKGLTSKSEADHEKKIAEIGSFHLKLKTAELLLSNHKAPTKLFDELEKITKKKVQLTSLKYSYDPGFEVTLELTGNTDELASVALQKKKLLEDALFSTFVVSGITSSLETPGTEEAAGQGEEQKGISFAVKGILKDDIVTYNGATSVTLHTDPEVKEEIINPVVETVSGTTTSTTELNQ